MFSSRHQQRRYDLTAIKDIVDLITQLSDSVTDRKLAGELMHIQGMICSFQSEQAGLHQQRIDLITDNAKLKDKISSLEKEIVRLNKPTQPPINQLSEEEIKILIAIKSSEMPANQIAEFAKLDIVTTEYWLEELAKKKFIHAHLSTIATTIFSIAHGGREYLIKHKLL